MLKGKNRICSKLSIVTHLNGRGELLVSCVHLAFTFNQNNVQTREISKLKEQKVTLGAKEANVPGVSLTLWFLYFAGLERHGVDVNCCILSFGNHQMHICLFWTTLNLLGGMKNTFQFTEFPSYYP